MPWLYAARDGKMIHGLKAFPAPWVASRPSPLTPYKKSRQQVILQELFPSGFWHRFPGVWTLPQIGPFIEVLHKPVLKK